MKRKDFVKTCAGLGIVGGIMELATPTPLLAQTDPEKTRKAEQEFKENWVASLMKNMDTQLAKKSRFQLMETCGRDCARRGAIKMALECKGDAQKLVDRLAKFLGKEGNYLAGDTVHLEYPKCYCEMVAAGPERLPETWCQCSRGWVHEMFETVCGKPVKVELLQSIKMGASSCKFIVHC